MAATFYLEPAATLDVDVFVLLSNPGGALVSLTPIYEYLKSRGGIEDREHIVIGDWPVQFLVPANELETEACRALGRYCFIDWTSKGLHKGASVHQRESR